MYYQQRRRTVQHALSNLILEIDTVESSPI